MQEDRSNRTGAEMAADQAGEYLTEEEARSLRELFRSHFKSYQDKQPNVEDQEWLTHVFQRELPGVTAEAAGREAAKLLATIQTFEDNLQSCNEAAAKGRSKERWLADKIQEAARGRAGREYGKTLGQIDQALFEHNLALADKVTKGGVRYRRVSRPPVARLEAVEVSYMLDLWDSGKAVEAVPNQQRLEDVALDIGKNANVMAYLSASMGTGFDAVAKLLKLGNIDKEELVDLALEKGSKAALKKVVGAVIGVALRRGIIRFIPKNTPTAALASAVCMGVEDVCILRQVASGKLSLTKGLDEMGRVSVAAMGVIFAELAEEAVVEALLAAFLSALGGPLLIATRVIMGMILSYAGSKAGEACYDVWKNKVAESAKHMAKAAFNTLLSGGRAAYEAFEAATSTTVLGY